jgi:hypothetical protein
LSLVLYAQPKLWSVKAKSISRATAVRKRFIKTSSLPTLR